MDKLLQSGFACRLHVIGQQFRHSPPALMSFIASGLNMWTPGDIRKVEISTMPSCIGPILWFLLPCTISRELPFREAMQAGCIPVVPNRVAYTEYIPGELRYSVGSEEEEIDQLANLLRTTAESLRFYKTLKSRLSERYLSFYIKQEYATLFDRLLGGED